jgi:hypothetical protein
MGRLSWRWWPRNKTKSLDDAAFACERFAGGDRRHLLGRFLRWPAAARWR